MLAATSAGSMNVVSSTSSPSRSLTPSSVMDWPSSVYVWPDHGDTHARVDHFFRRVSLNAFKPAFDAAHPGLMDSGRIAATEERFAT